MSFSDLGLSAEVLRAVEDAGYQTPTPIQQKAIPYVLAAAIGVSVGSGAYWAMINKGVQQERARDRKKGRDHRRTRLSGGVTGGDEDLDHREKGQAH